MPHCDDDALALAALGEQLPAPEATHLDACPVCQGEVSTLRSVADAARVAGPLTAPPERVWLAIEAEIAGVVAPAPVDLASRRRSRASGRRRSFTPLLVAASVAAGAAGVLGIQAVLPGEEDPAVVQLASAALDPLPGWDASGSAVVEEVEQGRVLRVDLPGDVPTEGYREVWLISTDLQRLVSLGVLAGDSGSFDVPDDVDLTDFAVVDVSDEPVDGDPSHSGNSIVRGPLA